MHSQRLIRFAALGGMIGPLVFAAVLVGLTWAEYAFMRSLGWAPLHVLDWPSGLSLGPYGPLMMLTFVLSGLMMSVFALGMRAKLSANPFSSWGTALLAVAGISLMALVFPTDPTLRSTPATWHGILHDGFFVILGLTLLPSMALLGVAFRNEPEWEDLSLYTFVTVALIIPAFWLKGAAFYIFLAGVLAWSEVIALRLLRLSAEVG